MIPSAYDALVVGAGYIGCAVACHLRLAGLRVALLERGAVAAGASRANYGNIQIQDAELDHSLPLITAGWHRFASLEKELGQSIGYRRLGSLLLIETESQWQTIAARLPGLQAAGIEAELVPADRLPEIEPLLDPRSLLGACYHPREAQIDPFRFIWAYLHRAEGLAIQTGAEVTGFIERGGKIEGVQTNRGKFWADTVILATGAWTVRLGRLIGREWAIPHVHGQALVTARQRHLWLNNHLASAAFFEAIHEEAQESPAEEAVLAVSQAGHGNFLLGEAATITDDLGGRATPGGQRAIAALAGRFLPRLRRLSILRGWAAPVAFTADGLPFLGPVAGLEGLILTTAFKSTVIVTPLVGELVAQLVVEGRTDFDLAPFSPDREL